MPNHIKLDDLLRSFPSDLTPDWSCYGLRCRALLKFHRPSHCHAGSGYVFVPHSHPCLVVKGGDLIAIIDNRAVVGGVCMAQSEDDGVWLGWSNESGGAYDIRAETERLALVLSAMAAGQSVDIALAGIATGQGGLLSPWQEVVFLSALVYARGPQQILVWSGAFKLATAFLARHGLVVQGIATEGFPRVISIISAGRFASYLLPRVTGPPPRAAAEKLRGALLANGKQSTTVH